MHEFHELREGLLVPSQRLVHERDHIGLSPRNHFAVFAALIAIQYLFYADTGRSLGPTCRAASSSLAKLGMSRWLTVPNLVIVGFGWRFGWANVGIVRRVSQFAAPL